MSEIDFSWVNDLESKMKREAQMLEREYEQTKNRSLSRGHYSEYAKDRQSLAQVPLVPEKPQLNGKPVQASCCKKISCLVVGLSFELWKLKFKKNASRKLKNELGRWGRLAEVS